MTRYNPDDEAEAEGFVDAEGDDLLDVETEEYDGPVISDQDFKELFDGIEGCDPEAELEMLKLLRDDGIGH